MYSSCACISPLMRRRGTESFRGSNFWNSRSYLSMRGEFFVCSMLTWEKILPMESVYVRYNKEEQINLSKLQIGKTWKEQLWIIYYMSLGTVMLIDILKDLYTAKKLRFSTQRTKNSPTCMGKVGSYTVQGVCTRNKIYTIWIFTLFFYFFPIRNNPVHLIPYHPF